MDGNKPQCLGFIMDGNRRWAKVHGLPTYEGHKQGGEVLQDCITWLRDEQIPHGVFYAFSTENWNRSESEVTYLMDLFREWLQKLDERLNDQNETEAESAGKVAVRIVGRRKDFAPDIVEQMNALEAQSQKYHNTRTTIWLALSYGGRAEIIDAVNQAIERGEQVDEVTFEQLLWTADMPDPDLIVRTSGEQRLSNFMTWRSVYSELYFIEKHWPALTKADFKDILVEYNRRNRRNGT